MADVENAMGVLAESFWGRPANEAELLAMAGEMDRDARWIAPHAFGRDGGLFQVEPESFYALLRSEAHREPR